MVSLPENGHSFEITWAPTWLLLPLLDWRGLAGYTSGWKVWSPLSLGHPFLGDPCVIRPGNPENPVLLGAEQEGTGWPQPDSL